MRVAALLIAALTTVAACTADTDDGSPGSALSLDYGGHSFRLVVLPDGRPSTGRVGVIWNRSKEVVTLTRVEATSIEGTVLLDRFAVAAAGNELANVGGVCGFPPADPFFEGSEPSDVAGFRMEPDAQAVLLVAMGGDLSDPGLLSRYRLYYESGGRLFYQDGETHIETGYKEQKQAKCLGE